MSVCWWFSTITIVLLHRINYAQPMYPLYAIDSGHDESNLTNNDIQIIASNFTFIQANYSTKTLNAMHKINKHFKPITYINSDATDANELEKTDRFGCAYYIIATLTKSISTNDNTFPVTILSKNSNKSYLKTSTNKNGNYSDSNGYVTFIRIDNELMKITAVTSLNSNNQQTITVIRGFDNTKISSYSSNINIFCPVYNGGGYPHQSESDNNHINYIIDPEQSFGKNRLISHTIQAIQTGNNGSWFDCFSAAPWAAVDICGNPMSNPWSFVENAYFNRSTWRNANQQRLIYVLNETYNKLNYYPIILANNIHMSYWPNEGNAKTFLKQQNNVKYRTYLNGYSMERFAGAETGSGCPYEGDGLILQWNDYNTWLNAIQELMDASQSIMNGGIFPMIAQAGCKSVRLETVPAEERDNFEQYAYVSFLLGIESMNGNSTLGIPSFYQNKNRTLRYAYVHPRYFWNIGNPIESYKYDNITNYRKNGKNSFQRYFENGLIVINPTNFTDYGYMLNGSYYNPVTEEYVTSIDSVGQRGYILLKDKPK
eukprot:233841_1